MNTILTVPFTLSREEIQNKLAIKPGSRHETALGELLGQVEEIANPKALFRVSYIGARGHDNVTIEDATFYSAAMRANLENIGRVFPYVATCGREVDETPIDHNNIMLAYWLSTVKLDLLQSSVRHLRQTITDRYRLKNLSAMNPGSGEASVWPIEEQQLLFSLFGGPQVVHEAIGVQLTPTYLMIPDMSTSGILFPGETTYYNCQLCQRQDCPNRQVPFDAALWESVHPGSN
jgi:hypothetical protein